MFYLLAYPTHADDSDEHLLFHHRLSQASVFCAVRPDTNQTFPLLTTLGVAPTNFVVDAEDFAQNASYGQSGCIFFVPFLPPLSWLTPARLDRSSLGVTASAPPNNRQFLMTVQRTNAVKAFAGCIFFANWSIALVVVWMSFLTLVWRKEFAESLIVVPLTGLSPACTLPPNDESNADLTRTLRRAALFSMVSLLNEKSLPHYGAD